MAVRKRRSRVLWSLVSVVLLLVLVIAAVPLWFPWALPPIAKRFGASYANYRRVGYQRFQLSGFALTNSTIQFQAREATAFVPTVWLWKRLAGAKAEPFLEVSSWKYVPVTAKSSTSNAPVSVRSKFEDLNSLAATLDKWLPRATLTNGIIVIENQQVDIPEAVWTKGTLSGTASLSNQQPFTVTASSGQNNSWKLNLESEALEFRSAISIEDREGKLAVTGTADWITNHIALAAEFPGSGFIPNTASLRAEPFDVPAHLLGLEQYSDVTGALQAQWQTNHFDAQLTAKAVSQRTNLPPLDIQLRASGTTNDARLGIAKLSAPGLQAGLAEPVTVYFRPPFLSQPATLNVAADLDQQNWFAAQGKLSGQAILYPEGKFPRVTFNLSGSGVATSSLTTSNLYMSGELQWPEVDLKVAQVKMDDGSQFSLSGIYDLTQKTIRNGRLHSSGPFGGEFLPADYSFSSASMEAQFSGPLMSLTNSAVIAVKHLSTPHVNPLDLQAEWSAEGLNVNAAQVKIASGNSTLLMRGSAAFGSNEKSLTLTTLDLSTSNHTLMHLQQPARIMFNPGPGHTGLESNAPWNLKLDPLHLAGDSRDFLLAADVSWPESGTFTCRAQGLDARLLKDFIPKADAEAVLNSLDFSGGWTNGPIAFQLASAATLETKEHFPFSASARLVGGETGVAIEHLSVSSTNQTVCRAEGSLPAYCDPTRKDGMIHIDADAPLKLHLLTDPNSILWQKLAAVTGLRLQRPNFTASVEGTWAAPKGQVTLRAERIELSQPKHPLPAIQNLDVLVLMDRDSARVSRFNFDIENQPVSIIAQMPLGETFWSGLRHERRLPDWHQATAHLKMDNAQLAPFTPLLPDILTAQGSATADISLERGGNLHGELSIANARTHPLESIGPVRDIQALARLDGRQVRLEQATAEIGGQRVNIDGSLELNQQFWRMTGLPAFQVHLTGTNVPLARNPSILLRADLNLAATNSGSQLPVVSGAVRLRNSLYLADLQSLVPQRAASPRRRPPYFSIEAEPWAQWRVNVNVSGDHFLRVQTPVFQGTVSTVLTIEGTLKEPLALGVVNIDTGSSINFPFSSLDVRQGLISLTSENPYRPDMFVTAQSRRFGYDVKMEARGPVDQPVIQFSSIPGLSSAEIVLMLTAGQVPQGVGYTTTTQQRAEGLGLFVGKNLLSDFGIGGGQQRLTVRSGQEISESGRPTYDIEYKFTDRWSAVGGYDRFDQYNLNLKWKVYSK